MKTMGLVFMNKKRGYMKKNQLNHMLSGILIFCTLFYQIIFSLSFAYGVEHKFPPEWFGPDGYMDYHRMNFPGVDKPQAGFTLTNRNTGESQKADMKKYPYGVGSPGPSTLGALAGDNIQITDDSIVGEGTVINAYDFQIIETNVGSLYSGQKASLLSNYLLPNAGQFRFLLNVRDDTPHTEPWGMGNYSENGVQRSFGQNLLKEMGWWYYTHINVEVRQGSLVVESRRLNDTSDQGNGVLVDSEQRNVSSSTVEVQAPNMAGYELVGFRKAMALEDESAMYEAISSHRQSGSSVSLDFSYDSPSGAVIFYYIEGDSPPPGGGEDGDVEITFSPNATQEIGGKTKDNNSYWVNQDIPVTVRATGEVIMTNTASRSYTYTYEWEEEVVVGTDPETGETITETQTFSDSDSGEEDQEYTEEFTPASLRIGGTAGVSTTIPNGSSISIIKEEMNMKLTGEVAGWNRGTREWTDSGEPSPSPPQGMVVSASWTGEAPPTGPEPTDAFPAESGVYSLDKSSPVIEVDYSPDRDWWSNDNFDVAVKADDQSQQGASKVSGMVNSYFDITNLSYTGNKAFMGKRIIPHSHSSSYSYGESITINRDGVYLIPLGLEDLAGNKGIIVINGRTVSTNGSWTEGALPLDKTDPEPARFAVDSSNLYGYTKKIANVQETPSSYRTPGQPYGFEYTVDKYQNKLYVYIDDNLSGTGSDEEYYTHTNSSRLQYAWSKRYDQLTEVGGWQSFHHDYQSTNSLLSEHVQPSWSQPAYQSGNMGRVRITLDPHHEISRYGYLKEGLWYLHIRQEDRAGNVTTTVSPPLYLNKVKNLRVAAVADYRWESIFQQHNRQPTALQYMGIRVKDFPIFSNKWGHGSALGYQTQYKLDTVGYEEPQDTIQIQVKYHGMDNLRNLYRDVDVYLLNREGDYVRIDDIHNPKWDDQIRYYYEKSKHIILRPNLKEAIGYEADRELVPEQRSRQAQDMAQGKYTTYASFIFLPHEAKFVRKGYPLDLYQKKELLEYQVLITFEITGKKGHGQVNDLDYTEKEDQWAADNKWHQTPPTEYNSYGKNRPTNADVLGKGINKGEVIWWDLYRTIQDDFQLNRYW